MLIASTRCCYRQGGQQWIVYKVSSATYLNPSVVCPMILLSRRLHRSSPFVLSFNRRRSDGAPPLSSFGEELLYRHRMQPCES